jgi:SsrA-binding protein
MAEKKKAFVSKVNIKNKRASFDYLLLDDYTAGIVLTGTEIKSIRAGKASLVDTYCVIIQGEVWVKNMYVAHYEHGSYNNHVERRDRKLLLNRREIRKIASSLKAPGFTLVPTLLYIDENGRAKLDISIARGKKEYDKRETLKEKEDRREISRSFKKNY